MKKLPIYENKPTNDEYVNKDGTNRDGLLVKTMERKSLIPQKS